jgi:hypothetical protein
VSGLVLFVTSRILYIFERTRSNTAEVDLGDLFNGPNQPGAKGSDATKESVRGKRGCCTATIFEDITAERSSQKIGFMADQLDEGEGQAKVRDVKGLIAQKRGRCLVDHAQIGHKLDIAFASIWEGNGRIGAILLDLPVRTRIVRLAGLIGLVAGRWTANSTSKLPVPGDSQIVVHVRVALVV